MWNLSFSLKKKSKKKKSMFLYCQFRDIWAVEKWKKKKKSKPRRRMCPVKWGKRGIFFFFFPLIFISWRLITLQYCGDFCHTLTWISHGFTRIPHPDRPSHLTVHPIPLGLPSAPGPSTCLMQRNFLNQRLRALNLRKQILVGEGGAPYLIAFSRRTKNEGDDLVVTRLETGFLP